MLRSLHRSSMLCLIARDLCVSANQTLFKSSSTISSVQRRTKPRFVSGGFRVTSVNPFDIRSMSISATPSSVMTPTFSDNGEEVELLSAVEDTHGGVIVEMKTPMDYGAFVSSLKASISQWREQGKKGIWIKLPIELSNLVQATVEEGFWYHHAEPKYLMLVKWIPDTDHTLPINATHRVGIGAFVMNDKREVLVVQEKSGTFRGTGIWKFPTGVVEEGEEIFAGAVREVKEETGIDTEFVEILGFRQIHKVFFEKSDLFCVCMLRPLSFDIQKQESEIEAAKWMPIEDYAAQPFVQEHELLTYIIDIALKKTKNRYTGFSPVQMKSGVLYLNSRDLNQPLSSGNES